MACFRVRQGRNGGAWRHVKEVMQGKGQRIMFVDGMTSIDDLARVKTTLIQGRVTTPRQSFSPVKDGKFVGFTYFFFAELSTRMTHVPNCDLFLAFV